MTDTPHFFISNIFISKARLILAKNQVNVKQHPEAGRLVLENYTYSSSTLLTKNNRTFSKKVSKRTVMSVFMRLHH